MQGPWQARSPIAASGPWAVDSPPPGVNLAAKLDISPSRILPNGARAVTFIGTETTWLSGAPTFTPSGVSGVSSGSVTVVSDTVATATVTYGTSVGTLTWTDSTTSATRNQLVTQTIPRIAFRRRSR